LYASLEDASKRRHLIDDQIQVNRIKVGPFQSSMDGLQTEGEGCLLFTGNVSLDDARALADLLV
jgi:hypothetical protein